MNVTERVSKLQDLLKSQNLAAYVVPSADPHQSEYVAEKWNRRKYISGFTGSAGLFAMSADTAGLWTDGRYFEQAETELKGTPIKLFKQGVKGVPEWQDWMIQTLKKGSRVGINPNLFSTASYQKIQGAFDQAGLELVPQAEDLVDKVWADKRPDLPKDRLYVHPLSYAGESTQDKLKRLRAQLAKDGASALVVSALDEIAWLFNLRGRDVPCNPVFYAYAIVTENQATLYTETSKLEGKVKDALGSDVKLEGYENFHPALKQLSGSVLVDPNTSSAAVEATLRQSGITVLLKDSPLPAWKAVKNQAELDGMKASHVRDGAAVVKFARWLKGAIGKDQLDELNAADKLETFRQQSKEYLGASFTTISGYGAHGALPHYRATPENFSKLEAKGIYLVDSGGQYVDGTTDITRVFALGTPEERHKKVYTAVLKGHLLLKRTLFPTGTNGYQLDVLARQPIWAEGLDYNHGTGHGVGAALCVHEGPFSVSLRKNLTPLEVGHILSNEPGCYLVGDFGVRIENLVTVIEARKSPAYGTFLGFEDLTLCPYERELIDVKKLSPEERAQVDAYHARVLKELSPLLGGEDLAFLEKQTKPL